MNRKQTEKIIGGCLEIIRLLCLEYKPDFDVCSMSVFPHSTNAFIIDENTEEYSLKYDWREEEEE